ncbi:MAG TPA: hypothetical protein VIP05_33680 [Burkholderiaceae bacterium]
MAAHGPLAQRHRPTSSPGGVQQPAPGSELESALLGAGTRGLGALPGIVVGGFAHVGRRLFERVREAPIRIV